MVEENLSIPTPSPIEKYKNKREYAGGVWALVAIDSTSLQLTAKRLNITMPQRVVDAVDRYATEHGETRSGLLTCAALCYINRQYDQTLPQQSKRGKKSHKKAVSG